MVIYYIYTGAVKNERNIPLNKWYFQNFVHLLQVSKREKSSKSFVPPFDHVPREQSLLLPPQRRGNFAFGKGRCQTAKWSIATAAVKSCQPAQMTRLA